MSGSEVALRALLDELRRKEQQLQALTAREALLVRQAAELQRRLLDREQSLDEPKKYDSSREDS